MVFPLIGDLERLDLGKEENQLIMNHISISLKLKNVQNAMKYIIDVMMSIYSCYFWGNPMVQRVNACILMKSCQELFHFYKQFDYIPCIEARGKIVMSPSIHLEKISEKLHHLVGYSVNVIEVVYLISSLILLHDNDTVLTLYEKVLKKYRFSYLKIHETTMKTYSPEQQIIIENYNSILDVIQHQLDHAVASCTNQYLNMMRIVEICSPIGDCLHEWFSNNVSLYYIYEGPMFSHFLSTWKEMLQKAYPRTAKLAEQDHRTAKLAEQDHRISKLAEQDMEKYFNMMIKGEQCKNSIIDGLFKILEKRKIHVRKFMFSIELFLLKSISDLVDETKEPMVIENKFSLHIAARHLKTLYEKVMYEKGTCGTKVISFIISEHFLENILTVHDVHQKFSPVFTKHIINLTHSIMNSTTSKIFETQIDEKKSIFDAKSEKNRCFFSPKVEKKIELFRKVEEK